MYKILYNNQIIDVIKEIQYIKYLPMTKRMINVDKLQANGIISSNGSAVYHIHGTKNNFPDEKKTIQIVPIEEEEYLKLTTQVQENQNLEDRVRELETLVQNLQILISKN